MGSIRLISVLLISYVFSVKCGPVSKRQAIQSIDDFTSGCGSAHHDPLPTIIAGRAAFSPMEMPLRYADPMTEFAPLSTFIAKKAALSPMPLRYAEPISYAEGSSAFGYEFTVPVPPSMPHALPEIRAEDCLHTGTIASSEPAHLPPVALPPPLPPTTITTDCNEVPTLEYAPIRPLLPPAPPAELPLPTAEPCFDTAPIQIDAVPAPVYTEPATLEPAPAPIFTAPAELPPAPPTIMTEPLKTPDCFGTASAPALAPLPTAPQAIEFAPPPPPPFNFGAPILAGPTNPENCNGAGTGTGSFTYPAESIEGQYDYNALQTPNELPEVLDARMSSKVFERFIRYGIAKN